MTTAEKREGTARLLELERKKILPAETIRELWKWWRGHLHDEEHPNVILFPSFTKNKRAGKFEESGGEDA